MSYSSDPAVLEEKMSQLAYKLIRQLEDPDYPEINFLMGELNSIFQDYKEVIGLLNMMEWLKANSR